MNYRASLIPGMPMEVLSAGGTGNPNGYSWQNARNPMSWRQALQSQALQGQAPQNDVPQGQSAQNPMPPNQALQGQAIQNQVMTGGMAQPMRPAPKAVLLKALNEYSFAMDEAALFLDTHPDNQEALSYFKNAVNMRRTAMNAYEQQYGPLFSEDVTADRWNWVTDVWPWEGEE